MHVITTLLIHHFHASPRNSVVLKIVISGSIVTPRCIPTSVIASPISPIIVKIRNDFFEREAFSSVTCLNTKVIESNQLTVSPKQNPTAVEIISDGVCPIKDGGNSQ